MRIDVADGAAADVLDAVADEEEPLEALCVASVRGLALAPLQPYLGAVRELRIDRCGLRVFEMAGPLPALEILSLEANELTSLPVGLGRLAPRLHTVLLSANRLRRLPAAVSELRALAVLHVARNELDALPSWLHRAAALRDLSVAGNALCELPGTLANLACLERLNISDNQIRRLPSQLRHQRSLRFINVAGNPLEHPPLRVALQGAAQIRRYLREHRPRSAWGDEEGAAHGGGAGAVGGGAQGGDAAGGDVTLVVGGREHTVPRRAIDSMDSVWRRALDSGMAEGAGRIVVHEAVTNRAFALIVARLNGTAAPIDGLQEGADLLLAAEYLGMMPIFDEAQEWLAGQISGDTALELAELAEAAGARRLAVLCRAQFGIF